MGIVDKILADHIVIDFETYFKNLPRDPEKYTLSTMTTPEFIHDPRFLLHGVAVKMAGQPAEFFHSNTPEEIAFHLKNCWVLDRPVIMHNAYFDDYILCNVLGLVCPQIIDTQGLALAVLGNRKETGQSTGLKELAKRLGLRPKGDLTYMNGKRNLSAAQAEELGEYAKGDGEITEGVLRLLLPFMSNPETELRYMQHTVRLFTAPSAGVQIDTQALEALRRKGKTEFQEIFTRAKVTEEEVGKDLKFRNLLATALFRTGRTLPMKQGKNGMIPATAKTDPAMMDMVEDDDPEVAALAEARLAKKSLDQFERRLDSINSIVQLTKGRLPLYLQYHGAHTGRPTGGDGLNQLNMGRDGLQGDIRGLYLPRPGNMLVIGDASQIEARIVAFLAGQHDLLDDFRMGRDVYVEFAKKLFKRDSISKVERALGKKCILGLGFGMGIGTLLKNLQKDPDLAPLLSSGEVSLADVRDMHQTYREAYDQIPWLWHTLEADLSELVRSGCPFGMFPMGWEDVCGKASAWVQLPSGRKLQYPELRLEYQESRSLLTIGKDGQMKSASVGGKEGLSYGRSGYLYGGKITENVVQAIARDILYEAVMACDAAGYRVVFHIYDEIILEVPTDSAELAKRKLGCLLSRSPAWAKDLPLAAEVITSERYCKA